MYDYESMSMTMSMSTGRGVGAGAEICLELEPEQEISKMGGSGNPDLKPEVSLPQSFVNPMFILVFFFI